MSDRTEAPTPRRLADARAEGQVAKSPEVSAAAALLVGALLLRNVGGKLVAELGLLMSSGVSLDPTLTPDGAWLRNLLTVQLTPLVGSLGLLLAGLLVTGLAAHLGQSGFLWAHKRLKADFSRLNPLPGLKRMFSAAGLVELGKALLKLFVVGWMVYTTMRAQASELLALAQTDLSSAVGYCVDLALALSLRVGAAYFVLAILDYAYQRWKLMKSLRMTKEEVKEDFKRSEGDPFIRNRIRGQQRRMARMRMMQQVPQADVIITNPTHLAIAVQYNGEQMRAPRVLAKGADRVAERIVALARERQIPIVQNIPVAHALFQHVDIDQEIPAELYMALAEVLAYVYRLKSQMFTA